MRRWLVMLLVGCSAYGPGAGLGGDLGIWRSTGGNEAAQAIESAELLEALAAADALQFEPYDDPDGKAMEMLMRERQRFVGEYFPLTLQRSICDHNQHVCTVNADGSLTWTNKPGDRLFLPRITFEPTVIFVPVEKEAGEPVEALWPADLDCSAYNVTCSEAVEGLNGKISATERLGSVYVPQTAYEADIGDSNISAAAATKWAVGGPETVVPPNVSGKFVTSGPASSYSAYGGGPDATSQQQLLDLIDFPFRAFNDMESEVKSEFREPVTIGVVDTWFDSKHCEFGGRITVVANDPPSSAMDVAACGTVKDHPNDVFDHATHVVGIIAADPDGVGVGGLNPFAKVVFRMIDLNAFRDPHGRDQISMGLMMDVISQQIDVFNFSWGYQNSSVGLDRVAEVITGPMRDSLVVVAAGNENENFEFGTCPILPACLAGAPNVVTVVGLDRELEQPRLWTAMDRGSNRNEDFHIGAIAADVVSTVSGNRLGVFSGTSQAAPQVTATAAYIISAFRHFHGDRPLPPIRVKNRLIYSADPFPALTSSFGGGRLNMARAMDIAVDQLVLRDAPTMVLRGHLAAEGRDGPLTLSCTDVDTEAENFVQRRRLDRLAEVQGQDGTFILYVRDGPQMPARRIGPCELDTLSPQIDFIAEGDGPEDARTRTIQVKDIIDFTSRMN